VLTFDEAQSKLGKQELTSLVRNLAKLLIRPLNQRNKADDVSSAQMHRMASSASHGSLAQKSFKLMSKDSQNIVRLKKTAFEL
jgi:hypothetical protein